MAARMEDIYESSDVPDVDHNAKFKRPETVNPDQVELIHVDMEAAKKRFTGRLINCTNVDFSDSIENRRRQAYGSNQYVFEVVGSQCPGETAEQKYNRLACEIAELAEQIKADGSKNSEYLTENSVNELLDELKAVRVTKTSGKPLPKKENQTTAKATPPADQTLVSLSTRLRRLEKVLGGVDPSQPPLFDLVDDLRYRTEALNGTYIEGLDSRLNTVLNKLDQMEKKNVNNVSGEFEAKVDELFELMNKWDASCSALPMNIKRLQALRALHEQAQHFGERISQLIGIKDQLEKAAASNRVGIEELQKQTRLEIASLVQQMNNIEAKLNK